MSIIILLMSLCCRGLDISISENKLGDDFDNKNDSIKFLNESIIDSNFANEESEARLN